MGFDILDILILNVETVLWEHVGGFVLVSWFCWFACLFYEVCFLTLDG